LVRYALRFDGFHALVQHIQVLAHVVRLPLESVLLGWGHSGEGWAADEFEQPPELVTQFSSLIQQAVLVGFKVLHWFSPAPNKALNSDAASSGNSPGFSATSTISSPLGATLGSAG